MSIFDVARRYGLDWASQDYGKPVQIRCPMHDDRQPSARVYPAPSNSLYCWTCQRSIGPTGLVVSQEGVGWGTAVAMLASWYHIDLTPDPDEEEARRLIGLGTAVEDVDPQEMRRAASVAVRAVGLPSWEHVELLLMKYEQLDLTDVDPIRWVQGAFQPEGVALQ